MSARFKKDDLRVRKTNEALSGAMFTLLSTQKFGKVSVNDLCGEAMISRATFYSHFIDKYGLLRHFLIRLLQSELAIHDESRAAAVIEDINRFISRHEKIIRNVVDEADATTLEILQEIAGLAVDRIFWPSPLPAETVLSIFCRGGLVALLQWQVKNRFPPHMQIMNADLYDVLRYITELAGEGHV